MAACSPPPPSRPPIPDSLLTPTRLSALRARLPERPLTRFAPSPTGYLHLGHVANAVYVWGLARALGGRVLLRLEDHDRGRCRPEYETALLDDLDWLGLEPDLGATSHFRQGPSGFRQSEADAVYEAFAERLRGAAPVYACDCSRKDIAAEAGDVPAEEACYPGTCRQRDLAPGPGRGLRVELAPGQESFEDARHGIQAQEPSRQCGDLLLRDRLGNWTYQFAVTVDDLRQGVDLVIRGDDLLPSTGRQVRLARLLGRRQPPVFCHHPLIRRPDGDKLSKSNRDTGIAELRAAGIPAGRVLAEAARRVGLAAAAEDVSPADLASLFHPGT